MKSKKICPIKFLTLCFAPALAGALVHSAHAASATWTGGVDGTATNLSSGANWSSGSATFVSSDVVTFDNATALGRLTWNANIGPGFGATDGLHVNYTGTNNLTLDGVTGTPGLQWGLGDITIASGAGAFSYGDGLESTTIVFRGAGNNQTYTNNSGNTATFASDMFWRAGGGSAKTLNLDGSGNWQFNAPLRIDATQGQTPLTVVKNGLGTVNFASGNNFPSTPSLTINDGAVRITGAGFMGLLGSYSGTLAIDGMFSYESSASQTLSGIVSGSGQFNQTAGSLTLTALNTFNGTATITGGTLNVGGGGSLDCSIIVNGANARYLQTSTIESSQTVALTQGTVGGTGTLSGVTVNDSAGAGIANGNNNSGTFTIGTLAFNGDGAITVTEDGNTTTPGIVVTGALSTTPANGTVTVNASSSFWDSGITYELVSAGTFNAALAHFTLGTINGVTGRQAPSLVATATGIGLLISGDNPKWSGLDSANWVVGSTGASSNWRLVSQNTPTNYIQGDVVLFDDSATNTAVSISAANVQPAVVNYNNSSKNFTLSGPFGISSGVLNKNGSGNVTISAPNTFTGGTTLNAGTLTLSGAGTLGASSNALTVTGGTINLGATNQTVGAFAITGGSTIQNGTLTAPGLLVSNPSGNVVISSSLDLGAGTLGKSGDGTLTLSGTTAYSGLTTISGGVLALSGTGSLDSTSGVTMGGGSLDLGGKTLNPGAVTVSLNAAAADTITNGSISPTSFTFNSIDGVSTISANIIGSTGVTAARLPAPNPPPTGTLSLTGQNTFTGPLNFTGPATVSIDGGTNTGGGAITYNSFGSTFTINGGSYLTSGITSSGYSEFRNLNLNSGVLESQGNIFAENFAISINFNGGTLKSGSAAGITVYEANNQIAVALGGAILDTTTGNITVGLNTGGAAALANPLTRLNGTASGTITLLGGKTLISGIANNGLLDIQGGSTWNLKGVPSSVAGVTGNGSITSSPGGAVLTLNMESSETYSGSHGGGISLVKLGAGTQTFSGSVSQLGDITVSAGTLEFTGNSATTFSDSAVITLNNNGVDTSGVLTLTNNVSDTVSALIVNGVPLVSGTYDANSPQTTGLITGNGKLVVAAGFGNWMSQFTTLSVADRLATADPDKDGIVNLVEYAIDGLSPIETNSLASAYTGTGLTFNKRAEAVQYVDYGMDVSTDLGMNDPWTVVTAPNPNLVETGGSISYTFNPATDGLRDFVRLKVSQK